MHNDFEMTAFMEYARKLIWQQGRKRTLLQASIDTDISSRTYEILEFIARELEEKEMAAT